jgi:sigma-B regulation protein RsbU (phosphoserine phosphatase)
VLKALNSGFQMERQQGRYLTLWYGVYQASSRTLRFASAGHPPALIWSEDGESLASWLKGQGMALGLFEDATYITESHPVDHGACLLVYSDGLYEVVRPDEPMGSLPEFVDLVEDCRDLLRGEDGLDRLQARIQTINGNASFTDDYSVFRVIFP